MRQKRYTTTYIFLSDIAEADLRYAEHLCGRAKISLSLGFLSLAFLCSPTQLFDVPLDSPL